MIIGSGVWDWWHDRERYDPSPLLDSNLDVIHLPTRLETWTVYTYQQMQAYEALERLWLLHAMDGEIGLDRRDWAHALGEQYAKMRYYRDRRTDTESAMRKAGEDIPGTADIAHRYATLRNTWADMIEAAG